MRRSLARVRAREVSAQAQPPPVRLQLSARFLTIGAVLILGLLLVADVALYLIRYKWGYDRILGIFPLFNFDAEANLPTWFSVALLVSCALMFGGIGRLVRRRDPREARYWFGLAALTLYVGIDEGSHIHEITTEIARRYIAPHGWLYFGWVIPGSIIVAGLAVAFFGFWLRLEEPLRARLMIAAIVYVSGGLGMEMVGGRYFEMHGATLAYGLLATLEETLEMAGSILLLRALVLHAARLGLRFEPGFRDGARPGPDDRPRAAA